MAYNLRGGGALRHSEDRAGIRSVGKGVDPMSNVANLVDAMLVLCLGLMVAIVMFWNVDLRDVQEMVKQDEMTQVDDVKNIEENIKSSGSNYNELGKVYEDPATGKLYMLTKDADKGASGSDAAKKSSSSKSSK